MRCPPCYTFSVLFFFAGLLILLQHISRTVFNAVVGWVVLCVVIYGHITFLPISQPDNPHFTPLSSMVYHVYADILYPIFDSESLSSIIRGIRNMNVRRPAKRLLERPEEKAEKIEQVTKA
jgi:hypothetical protein